MRIFQIILSYLFVADNEKLLNIFYGYRCTYIAMAVLFVLRMTDYYFVIIPINLVVGTVVGLCNSVNEEYGNTLEKFFKTVFHFISPAVEFCVILFYLIKMMQ